MRDSEVFELITAIIQEAYKKDPNTKIHRNYKFKNSKGRNREFDVVIESKVNNFEVIIVIECKNYTRKISVDKIEAFEGKCKRLTQINKKIFVSKRGFQLDAINAAEEFGIELYTLEELTKEEVNKWLDKNMVKPLSLEMVVKEFRIYFKEKISTNELSGDTSIYLNSIPSFKSNIDQLQKILFKLLPKYGLLATSEEVVNKTMFKANHPIILDGAYIIHNDQKFSIDYVQFKVEYNEIPLKGNHKLNTYKAISNNSKNTTSLTTILGKSVASAVKTSNNEYKFIITDEQGNNFTIASLKYS